MRHWEEIETLAAKAQGGVQFLEKRLADMQANAGSQGKLSAIPDDRFLSHMTRAVFQAGFSWKVIEAKWDGFEAAFEGFDPARMAFYGDEDLDRLVSDARIVRNGQKIKASIHNAGFVRDIAAEHGSFGAFLENWPSSDQIGLMERFKKEAKFLSGGTGMYFLRFVGWDSFILSKDVTAALIREGVIDKPATSKTALKQVQAAFNQWTQESDETQNHISRVLALSVGPGS